MMDIKQQQETVNKLLPILRLYSPDLTIAGGCPRDWFLGNTCRDIDVYIPVRNVHTLMKEDIPNLEYALGFSLTEVRKESEGTYSNISQIFSVFRGEFEGITFDFIFTAGPTHKVPGWFSSSICRIELDLDNMIPLPTKSFMQTVQTKVVQYSKEVTEDNPHYKKMVENFPEFTHELPSKEKMKKARAKKRGDTQREEIAREYPPQPVLRPTRRGPQEGNELANILARTNVGRRNPPPIPEENPVWSTARWVVETEGEV